MSTMISQPSHQGIGRSIIAMVLGIAALISFVWLTLPTDLLLFDLRGVPVLEGVAQMLNPLALGPEILYSPICLLLAIAAIVLGRHSARTAARTRRTSDMLARTAAILGWVVVALYVVSFGLVILSFQGILKPLI